MADDGSGDNGPVTFNVKSSSDTKYTITMSPSATVTELKEKLATKDYADIEVDRQRLVYSGRVLKDPDTIGSYKIKQGHTIHLVKGAASNRPNPASSQGSSAALPNLPTNLSAGTGNNPLAGLTGARYAGFAQLPNQEMFGPDGGMGPPPDPEDMIRMLQNPQFASTLNEALSNPQLIDTMIQQNPMLRGMGPQVRQMMQTPEFRRMMTDPEQLRSMLQVQRMLGGAGMGPGGATGNAAFPMPGVTDTTPGGEQAGTGGGGGGGGQQGQRQQPPVFNPLLGGNPFGALNPGQMNNPFGALFNSQLNPAAAGSTAQNGSTNSQQSSANNTRPQSPSQQQQSQSPFTNSPLANTPLGNLGNNLLQNPALMSQILAAMNPTPQQRPPSSNNPSDPNATSPQQPAQNPFASLFNPALLANNPLFNGGAGLGNLGAFGAAGAGGGPAAEAPTDNRPPEERYAEQLRQLNEMGFFEFERNVEALRRTGGNVEGAVEYLLSHG